MLAFHHPVKLNGQHIRALNTLPEPTKRFAVNAARTGSLADITALNKHVFTMTTAPPLPCYNIVTMILQFLGAHKIPGDMSREASADLVIRVRLLLEILSQLAHLLQPNDQHYVGLASYILSQHDHIFPWLDFLQRRFFGRSDPIFADDEHRMTFIIAHILYTVARVRDAVNPTEHTVLGEMVIHIWHKLLRIDIIYTWSDAHLLGMVVNIDAILPVYLLVRIPPNRTPPQYVMDAVGGPSAVIAFTLARMERDLLNISPRRIIPYMGIKAGFANLSAFLGSPIYGSDILEQGAIIRSTDILGQVIELGPPSARSLDPSSPIFDQIIDRGIEFLICCLGFGPQAVGEILDSGLISILRTRVIPMGSLLPQVLGGQHSIQLLPVLTLCNFVYPSVVKPSKKRLRATPPMENCPLSDLWELYDAYVSAYAYLWDRAGSMAVQFNKCATCKLDGSDHYLKVCAGCHVLKYCSPECQRISWNNGHRTNCLMFQYSHPRRVAITSCRDFLYLACVEHFVLQESSTHRKIDTAIASSHQLPPSDWDEIPVVFISIDPRGSLVNLVRMKTFPAIFGTRDWRRSLLPKFRQLMDAGQLEHLTVILCPDGHEVKCILGALASSVASGMVDRTSWDREAGNYESIRPRTWPKQW